MSTDVQRFDSDGTWVKPPGAVRLTVSLKGGTGDNSLGGLHAFPRVTTFGGGGGGGASIPGGGSGGYVLGGGGSGGGGSAATPAMNSSASGGGGSEGQLVKCSFAADEVPDRMDIKIGRGGWAEIVTDLSD